jgi:hypothetical protein
MQKFYLAGDLEQIGKTKLELDAIEVRMSEISNILENA